MKKIAVLFLCAQLCFASIINAEISLLPVLGFSLLILTSVFNHKKESEKTKKESENIKSETKK